MSIVIEIIDEINKRVELRTEQMISQIQIKIDEIVSNTNRESPIEKNWFCSKHIRDHRRYREASTKFSKYKSILQFKDEKIASFYQTYLVLQHKFRSGIVACGCSNKYDNWLNYQSTKYKINDAKK